MSMDQSILLAVTAWFAVGLPVPDAVEFLKSCCLKSTISSRFASDMPAVPHLVSDLMRVFLSNFFPSVSLFLYTAARLLLTGVAALPETLPSKQDSKTSATR